MSLPSLTATSKKKLKIVFLGDQSVGKTCIISQFVNHAFEDNQTPTIGIDFLVSNYTHNNKNYRLQLWDTAGQQRFKSLIPSYLKDSRCAIVVYDVTNKQSFDNAFEWRELYQQHKDEGAFVVIVGNKIDLIKRQITFQNRFEQLQILDQKCQMQGLDHFQISAKTCENSQELFISIIEKSNKMQQGNILSSHQISLPQAMKNNGDQSHKAFNSPRDQTKRIFVKDQSSNIKLTEQQQDNKQIRKRCC